MFQYAIKLHRGGRPRSLRREICVHPRRGTPCSLRFLIRLTCPLPVRVTAERCCCAPHSPLLPSDVTVTHRHSRHSAERPPKGASSARRQLDHATARSAPRSVLLSAPHTASSSPGPLPPSWPPVECAVTAGGSLSVFSQRACFLGRRVTYGVYNGASKLSRGGGACPPPPQLPEMSCRVLIFFYARKQFAGV